jgi:hypothetical protein
VLSCPSFIIRKNPNKKIYMDDSKYNFGKTIS